MYHPEADHRTTLRGDAVDWFVVGARQQARVSRGAGCSLADASGALAWHEARQAGEREHELSEVVRDATGAYIESKRDRPAHAGRVTDADLFELERARQERQRPELRCYTVGILVDDNGFRVDKRGNVSVQPLWSHSRLTWLSRRGNVVTDAKRRARQANAKRASAAKRISADPMTGAEREAARARRAREERAREAGATLASIEAERAAWLAKRAKRSGQDSADRVAAALAVTSDSWDRDTRATV